MEYRGTSAKTVGEFLEVRMLCTARKFKLDAIMMYINSMGIRAIARVKKVHNSVISVWIRQMGEVIKGAFHEKVNEITPQDINILELDELFTYVKKKRIRCIYLVLSTETGSELLISK